MKLNFLLYFLLSFFIYLTSEENAINRNNIKIINTIKNKNLKQSIFNTFLSRKEEKNISNDDNNKTYDDNNKTLIEIDSLINNITEKFENQIYNLTIKINKMINSSLEAQNELIKKTRDEKILINGLLDDIKLLKERNKQNMKFTFIICIVIFIIFFIFCIFDYLRRQKTISSLAGYQKAREEQKTNIQLDII